MMTHEEIRLDLIKFVKGFYEYVDVLYLDLAKEEVELRFHLKEKDRSQILGFYENNREIFKEETLQTREDLHTLDEISIRIDPDGIYFGKSSYDLLAINVVAFYLLEKYLNQLVELLPEKLKDYRLHYIYQ